MKKKIMTITVTAALIAVIMWYFRPVSMSTLIHSNHTIQIICTHFGIKDGQPLNNSESFTDLTKEQMDNVKKQLSQYSYRRKWNTVFSDGSFHNMGEYLMHIYIYEDNVNTAVIAVASDGQAAINKRFNKNYTVKNSDMLIDDILNTVK